MKLSDDDKRLFLIADEIVDRYGSRGRLYIVPLENRIRLRTAIFEALRSEAARPPISQESGETG